MKFPFPKWLPKIPVQVYYEGTDSNGEYVKALLYDGVAFYDEKTRQVLDAQRRLVMLSGLIIIEGDIAMQSPTWPADRVANNDPIDGDTSIATSAPASDYWALFFDNPIGTGEVSGFVKVNGSRKAIFNTLRPRNPDGTVFSTELMLA